MYASTVRVKDNPAISAVIADSLNVCAACIAQVKWRSAIVVNDNLASNLRISKGLIREGLRAS